MPTIGDISQFLGRQTFGSTTLPATDLSGKTIIVTGSNTGLGFECAKHLWKPSEREAAKLKILEDVDNHNKSCMIEVWQVDLCNYKSVLAFINRVSSLPRLDGLVANAGVEMTDFKLSEGLETTLTVNVVSTYLMAIGVLPKLEESSVHFNAETNLSIVGSMVHAFGPNTQLEVPESRNVLEVLSDPATADMGMRYTLSKLMVHQLFHEFAQRISSRAVNQKSKVVLNNVNPGWCASELSRYKSASLFERGMFAAIGRTAEQGSRTLVHAVTAGKDTHDRYLSECQVVSESTYMRSDRGRRMSARLWRELIARFEVIAPGVAAIVQ